MFIGEFFWLFRNLLSRSTLAHSLNQSQRLSPVTWLAFLLLLPTPVWAQSIQPSVDGTSSTVTQSGNFYTIDGGSRSQNGANLFHSFTRFGLNAGEVANFLASPTVQNILGRVTGGETSVINGLIQVTGSNANLYLMNPAGILFGPNASLNIPASFTATTATRIGFGADQWFYAIAPNQYATLNGTPTDFAFSLSQPGAIANLGNLAVNPGASITLIGGTVLNAGTLTAPGGHITLTAVPGETLVRLSQPGSLLNLEFLPLTAADTLTVPTLAQLLTGGSLGNANGIIANADGTITLTRSGTSIAPQPGTAIASGTLSVAGVTGGSVTVVGNQVDAIGSTINASGTNGGGSIRIGGDYQGRNTLPGATTTTISPDSILQADALTQGNGGQIIIWANELANIHGTLTAQGGASNGNGGFIETSGRRFLNLRTTPDASAPNGNGGTWLIDPTDITIVAGVGTDTLNTIFSSSINSALDANTNVIISTDRGGTEAGNIVQNSGATIFKTTSGTATLTLQANNDIILNDQITVFSTGQPFQPTLNVVLNAAGNITTNSISAGQGSITITSNNGAINTRGQTTPTTLSAGNNVALNAAGNITTNNISTTRGITLTSRSGAIDTRHIAAGQTSFTTLNSLSAGDDVILNAAGNITTDNIFATRGITLTSRSGAIDTQRTVSFPSTFPPGSTSAVPALLFSSNGAINLSAAGNIEVGSFTTGSGRGDITITSSSGAINTVDATLDAFTINTEGGNITLSAAGNITVDGINSSPSTGSFSSATATATGGNILLSSRDGTINAGTPTTDSLTFNITSGGGNIRLEANNGITANGIDASTTEGINGGAIALETRNGDINVGTISSQTEASSVSLPSNGGAVSLNAPGNITVFSINTQSIASQPGQGGVGGAVNIRAGGFFRATDTIVDQNNIDASITTAGGTGGGAIAIAHGGRGETPFTVGDASTNGTAGAITSGTSTILPLQSFRNTVTIGNISITTFDNTICTLANCDSPDSLDDMTVAEAESTLNLEAVNEAQSELQQILAETGIKPALIYLSFAPSVDSIEQSFRLNEQSFSNQIKQHLGKPTAGVPLAVDTAAADRLEILLITATGAPIRKRVNVTRAEMLKVARQFRNEVAAPFKTRTTSYLPSSQQLYDWIIRPLEADLKAKEIQNLNFIAETGLRFMPFAALHSGNGFLIDQYSLGLMPSLSLVDTRHVDIRNAQLLLGGTSTFVDLNPLPAVPTELAIIASVWQTGTKTLKAEQFTTSQLRSARQQQPFGIVHLATHGEFKPGDRNASFIQFSDTRLQLDQLRSLGFNNPPVELMVLSACNMALGSDEAELGFAGLALQLGAKSVLASLWSVNDEGTLALMTSFYQTLQQAPIKAEALRQAQQALRNRQITVKDGQLIYTDATGTKTFDLPQELQNLGNLNLSHPYYWSAFTMLGSPW